MFALVVRFYLRDETDERVLLTAHQFQHVDWTTGRHAGVSAVGGAR